MIWQKYWKNKKILFLNDRHEEADTEEEDRQKLYDQRILPLLNKNDYVVFAKKIDPFLLTYYRSFGLATISRKNILEERDYLNHISLTKAVLNDEILLRKLKKINPDFIIPYIESQATEILARKIGASLLRKADFTDWINNKNNYRQIIKKIGLKEIPGLKTNFKNADKHFEELRKQGFQKIILKRERSVSGFGIFILKDKVNLHQCLKKNFGSRENFVMEGFIEKIQNSPNFQYFITANKIELITTTDQLLEKDAISYSGNIYPLPLSLSESNIFIKINKFSHEICTYLQKNKCFGVVGIDYIVTKDDKIYSTEANVRLNGSTFPALIVRKLFGKRETCWLFKTFHFNKPISFEKLLNRLSNYFLKPGNKNGIFPVGVDLLESVGEGQFLLIAENHNKLYDLFKFVEKNINGR